MTLIKEIDMAIRAIRVMGDNVLNKKCKEVKEVNDRTKILIEDMIETMREAGGVGLAAPQIGVLKRIVVIETEPDNVHVLINPVIIKQDGEQVGYEGCLSVPGKSGIVKRPNHVVAKAFDLDMNEYTIEGEGLLARAICHECAHLDGELYVDLVEGELIDNEELEKMYEEEEDEELPVSGESEYATGIDFERVLEALAVIHRNASSIAERQRAGETLTELEGTRLMETLRSDKVRSSTIDDIVRNRFEELYVPSDGRDK